MICAVVNANDHSVISSNLPMLYEVNQPTSNVVVYRGRNVELAIPKLFGYSSKPKANSYDPPTTYAPPTKPATVRYTTTVAPTYPTTTTTTTARPVYKPKPTKPTYPATTTQATKSKYSSPKNSYNTYSSGSSYGHGNVHSSYPASTYHQQPQNSYSTHNAYDYAPVRDVQTREIFYTILI